MYCVRYLFLLLVHRLVVSDSANILALVPTPVHSHQTALWPVWKALSEKGHNVTLVTTQPRWELTNIKHIDISFLIGNFKDINTTQIIIENGDNFVGLTNAFLNIGLEVQNDIWSHGTFRNLVKDKNTKFDLVMCEQGFISFYALAQHFNAPLIVLSSMEVNFAAHECLGNPIHPLLYPDPNLPLFGELTFFERLISTATLLKFKALYGNIWDASLEISKEYIDVNYSSGDELRCSMDMLFLNVNPVLNNVRPTVPGVINIGGDLHIGKPKKLPKDLQDFLDGSEEGVVYFSLGSNVRTGDLSEKTKSTIMKALSEIPHKVLCKFETEELPYKPSNVKIVKWLPQQDVLRHPNIKAFITQAGLQSIDESIFNRVPMVAMPLYGDQFQNTKKIVRKGIALEVDHSTFDKDTFKNAILEVIDNPKYKNTISQMSELILDRPMSGVEQAVWWTEYVIRHKGAKHLKGPAKELPYYQFFLLDVVGTILLILSLAIFIIYKITKFTLNFVVRAICKCPGKKQKTQ